MSYYNENARQIQSKLNETSCSFCPAKWTQVTIHLQNGFTHSCHHPAPHKIPLEELEKNPHALHNTQYKIEQRKQMLEGKQPKECNYCWNIENLGKDHLSDRHYKSSEYWSAEYIDTILQDPLSEKFLPTYLEVSFSNVCNLNCMYCSPQISSKWQDDIRRNGPYDLGDFKHADLGWLDRQGMTPIPEREDNPYVNAFWKIWPELSQNLRVFRITGGEPLMSKHTWRILEYIQQNPNPNMELLINTNLCVQDKLIDRLIEIGKDLIENEKVKRFEIYTSIESTHEQAEYIRPGLDYEKFIKNLMRVTTEMPMIKWRSKVVIMATFNLLSIPKFRLLLDWLLEYRLIFSAKDWKNIWLDISYLRYPSWQTVSLANKEMLDILKNDLDYMKENDQDNIGHWGFQDTEIEKFERMYEHAVSSSKNVPAIEYTRFYNFYREHDKRKGFNFVETFPELEKFYNDCKPQ